MFLLGNNKVPYLLDATPIGWSVYTDQCEKKVIIFPKARNKVYFGTVNYKLFGTVNYYTK